MGLFLPIRGRCRRRRRRGSRAARTREPSDPSRQRLPALPPSPEAQSTVCRCQIVRIPNHSRGFPMDGAVPVSVRPRESRKPSLSTASSGIVLDFPWIEALGWVAALTPSPEGREEAAASAGLSNMQERAILPPIRASSQYPVLRYARVATITALMVWRRFSAWSKTMLAGDSKTASVTSSPSGMLVWSIMSLPITVLVSWNPGRQCMK
jgi:hypothetical protein